MKRVIIGIDPGLQGAIAAIDATDRQLIEVVDCPVRKHGGAAIYNIPEMANTIRRLSLGNLAVVYLEQSQSMPGQGVSSTFKIGRGMGIWEGILAALSVPYRTVRPIVWTKKVFTGMPADAKGKFRSVQFAMQMFPDIELTPQRCRTPKDGRADAACIAYYGALEATP